MKLAWLSYPCELSNTCNKKPGKLTTVFAVAPLLLNNEKGQMDLGEANSGGPPVGDLL
jgi:hypothetical protein